MSTRRVAAAFALAAPFLTRTPNSLAQRRVVPPSAGHSASISLRAHGRVAAAAMALVTPAEAHARRAAGAAALVDVRTVGEFANGHPVGAVNVPFMDRDALGAMVPNPTFVETMGGLFKKEDALLLSCQSGKRSAMAVAALQAVGYTNLVDVEGGFGAWGALPTET
jgi:rhodanese-related sulfurtransferase